MNEIQAMNILGSFCAERQAFDSVDVLALIGGSIPQGMDVFMDLVPKAKHTILVGGRGHTTNVFESKLAAYLDKKTGLSEAEIFQTVLEKKYGYRAEYLETTSTNCGENAKNMIKVLKEVPWTSIALIHDGTMQKRMEATLRKYAPHVQIINYASYQVEVQDDVSYSQELWGMWDMEHYRTLLMGEIARLHDTKEGYGPKGKDFIVHVDIPDEVLEAYHYLKGKYPNINR